MLAANSYPRAYVDACRERIAAQVSAYRNVVASSSDDAAIKAFEPHYFNTMLVALENCFVHRTRALERKDGNPLNEVRMLCNSILSNNSILVADKTIKYDPARAVVKYEIGDQIKLTEDEFVRLSTAFLEDLEQKFVAES